MRVRVVKSNEDCGTACAAVYAAWGDGARALDWLETAIRCHDPYLELTAIKVFDPLDICVIPSAAKRPVTDTRAALAARSSSHVGARRQSLDLIV